jgi:glyceraldehyde 3-phosphate dehydrogenase
VPPSSTSSSPGSIDGTLVKVMAWYANEWGFAHQMIREARCTLGVLDAR